MIHLIEPDLGRVSGGLRYNAALAAGVEQLLGRPGVILRHAVPGAWPHPGPDDEAALHQLVSGLDGAVVVDGLIGSSLRAPVQAAGPVVQLLHALLGDGDADADAADAAGAAGGAAVRERERAALQAADAVVTTSRHAADVVAQLYGITATAITPGVDPRPQATGTLTGHRWICVGAVEPNKNQLFLTEVLAELAASGDAGGLVGGQVTFAGPHTDPDYAAALREACAHLPPGTATVAGPLSTAALDRLYAGADLLLLPSHRETYGMVVTEAAAAGLPALVSAGTGAEEALVVGMALSLQTAAWADALRDWLALSRRLQWRAEAAARRTGLRRWTDAALDLMDTLDPLLHSRPNGPARQNAPRRTP